MDDDAPLPTSGLEDKPPRPSTKPFVTCNVPPRPAKKPLLPNKVSPPSIDPSHPGHPGHTQLTQPTSDTDQDPSDRLSLLDLPADAPSPRQRTQTVSKVNTSVSPKVGRRHVKGGLSVANIPKLKPTQSVSDAEIMKDFANVDDYFKHITSAMRNLEEFSTNFVDVTEKMAYINISSTDVDLKSVANNTLKDYHSVANVFNDEDGNHGHSLKLVSMLGEIISVQAQLHEKLRSAANKASFAQAQYKSLNFDYKSYLMARQKFEKNQQQYFALNSDFDPQKLFEADVKYNEEVQALELMRFDLGTKVQSFEKSRSVSVMEHLATCLQAYGSFLQEGYELYKSVQGQMAAYEKTTQDLRNDILTKDKSRQMARRHLEQEIDKFEIAKAGGTGVRDLDNTPTDSSESEYEGTLYIPSPVFEPVLCTLYNGVFTVFNKDKPVILPVLLCTVKENRDLKVRFVFSVMSPTETINLQAKSPKQMSMWMTIIQNAILGCLNAQTGNNQQQNERNIATFEELRTVDGNLMCADCSAPDPDWCSLNLGILVCLDCCGIHRSLGVHRSKPRGLKLDSLESTVVKYMKQIGNTKSNSIWEAKLSDTASCRIDPKANRQKRDMFIRAKYEFKSFMEGVATPDQVDALNQELFAQVEAIGGEDVAPDPDKYLKILRLIARGAQVNAVRPAGRTTALHLAVQHADIVTIEMLLQNDAKVLVQDEHGWTPLYFAAASNFEDAVQLLLTRGGVAQVGYHATGGGTMVDYCRYHLPNSAVLRWLEEAQSKAENLQRDQALMMIEEAGLFEKDSENSKKGKGNRIKKFFRNKDGKK